MPLTTQPRRGASGTNADPAPGADSASARQAAWKLGFFIAAAWIAVLSLSPFEVAWGGFWQRLHAAFALRDAAGGRATPIHVAGFAAAGFLAYKAYHPWLAARRAWQVLLVMATACLLLEAAKLAIAHRHALLIDGALKALAASAGAALAAKWRIPAPVRHGRALVSLAAGLLAVAVLVLWWYVGLQPLLGGALRLDWNPGFRLMVGNEGDGSRPWQGQIHDLALYDRALAADEITRPPRAGPAGPIIHYAHFGDPAQPVVPGGSLAAHPALVMEAEETGFFATRGAATPLTQRIAETGAFAVAATLATAHLSQTGPARVVSLSHDRSFRNFTLGQHADQLVFRVANGVTGSNGTGFELQQKALDGTGPHHVVATYDHGVSTMYVDGVRLPASIDLREPYYYLPVEASAVAARGVVLVMLVVSFMMPACLALRLWLPGPGATLALLGLLYLLAVLPFALCCLAGGPWSAQLPLALLLATAILMPLSIRWFGPRARLRLRPKTTRPKTQDEEI